MDPHVTCQIPEMILSPVLVVNKSVCPLSILRNLYVAYHYNFKYPVVSLRAYYSAVIVTKCHTHETIFIGSLPKSALKSVMCC